MNESDDIPLRNILKDEVNLLTNTVINNSNIIL
jgi:hypothetical protein